MYYFSRGFVTAFILVLFVNVSFGQDPMRFKSQVSEIITQPLKDSTGVIIFTGSSSIRMWDDLDRHFHKHNVYNRGFGGSQMSDLFYFLKDLVLDADPCQVFIYEGDNDISSGKSTEEIMASTQMVLDSIKAYNPAIEVVLISPKPSVSRWELKEKYEALNESLAALAQRTENVAFADVWSPSLDEDGKVLTDIFVADNLHMNAKGYAIWQSVIGPFLQECK